MAKNRHKKKRNGVVSMDASEPTALTDLPQAMDTSESGAQKPASGSLDRKTKKGRPMKRSKNVRKMKAMAKSISLTEKYEEKILKNENKTMRIQSAKKLYD